jgi:ethanolamine permease
VPRSVAATDGRLHMSGAEQPDGQSLERGALDWKKAAALGVAIAISGSYVGWNYGLEVGGWGGMLVAALAMAVLFFCLTQCLAELAAALPQGSGFDFYAQHALGPAAGYIAGMSVAVALAVGTGLAVSFAEAYAAPMVGIGGWPVKGVLLVLVIGLQLRGAEEAAGLTMAIGAVALAILVLFCVFIAPAFQPADLLSARADGSRTIFPHGLLGAARCIPFALFLFLGVEQAAQAASEMKDMARSMPRALLTAIGIAFVIGLCVLVFATGGIGADRLAPANDPLYAALVSHPERPGTAWMARLVGIGALVALLGTFFSLAYAGSRQFYHLAGAGYLPRWLHATNQRRAPARALLLVGSIGAVAAAFSPDSVMVIFIFLISVSYVFVLASFLRLRGSAADLVRPYRALGGRPAAVLATLLSLAVMLSCYQLEVTALSWAIAALIALYAYFVIRRPGRAPAADSR